MCLAGTENNEERFQKYVAIKIMIKIKMRLDSGSDFLIVNLNTWKKVNKLTLLRACKTANVVNGTQINFEGSHY